MTKSDETYSTAIEPQRRKRMLIVTAVDAESDAVHKGIARVSGAASSRIDVIVGGVGPASAAARTSAVLALAPDIYELVVSAGIGGGFSGRAEIGDLVLAERIVAADLGAESPEGFLTLDELGFGSSSTAVSREWNNRLVAALQAAGLSVLTAPIITVSTVTGTASTAAARARLVPGAAAEGMEGYGVAIAAEQHRIPAAELRAISNPVGPRDRSAWRIGDALLTLEVACAAIAKSYEDITLEEQP